MIIIWLVFSLTRLELTKHENMLLFVCTETTESKPLKLETSVQSYKTSTIVNYDSGVIV